MTAHHLFRGSWSKFPPNLTSAWLQDIYLIDRAANNKATNKEEWKHHLNVLIIVAI